MNMRRAALLLLMAAFVVGAFVAVGGHGSAEAAKTPATCSIRLSESFADNSAGWAFGPEWEIGPASQSSGHEIGYPDPAVDHTSGSDNGVAGVVIGGNATTNLHPYWYITSPTINASTCATSRTRTPRQQWPPSRTTRRSRSIWVGSQG